MLGRIVNEGKWLPSGSIKGGRHREEGIARCRGRSDVGSQTGRFSSSILHSFFRAGFREARVVSRNARMLPAAPPSYLFRAQTSRYRHLFAGLFDCNRSCALLFICHLLIYIYSCLFVSVPSCIFYVGPCPCVSLLTRNRALLSLSFPFHPLLFGSRPRWSRLVSPRTHIVTRQRVSCTSISRPT